MCVLVYWCVFTWVLVGPVCLGTPTPGIPSRKEGLVRGVDTGIGLWYGGLNLTGGDNG